MADESSIPVTLGGKNSSLSSSSVVNVANGVSPVRIDSSSLNRLFACSNHPHSLIKSKIYIPDILTLEEQRAYLVVLVNKLLLFGSSIRPVIPLLVLESLNADSEALSFVDLDVTEDENVLLKKSSAVLDGVAALLDHKLSALSTLATAAAALSCEAQKVDVSVFNTIDSDAPKDEVAVASDMKVLLNGSKSVGKVVSDTVLKIPEIHGLLRDVVRSVHSRTRVELNLGVKCVGGGLGCGRSGEVWAAAMSPLVVVLGYLGQSSLSRVKLNLSSISNDTVQSGLRELLEQSCPSFDSFRNEFGLVSGSFLQEDYVEFLHQVNMLLGMVKVIVDWEVITAYMSLEGSKLFLEGQSSGCSFIENGINVNSDKKNVKKRNVLGKGTTIIIEYIQEKVQNAAGEGTLCLDILEKCIVEIYSLLDPKKPGFDEFLNKVKDIVSCNESRRLPKLPKGTRDFAKEQMNIREKAFSIIVEVFKRHGATALDTPAFELKETLMGKYGEDSKLVYDLADQGGELCSLRYDLTVPFARYVAMNGITSFKRYQIAKVYRRDNPSKGRYREFYQCDFDIAGHYERMGPDFEVIKILTELLDELDIGDYEVKLNHRQLLDGMLELCGVPPEKFRTICSSIDKLDKIPFEQIQKEMVEEKGLTMEITEKIGSFVKEKGSPLQLLSKLKQEGSKFVDHNGSLLALNDLEILFKALEKSMCLGKVVFDLSLARGLDYYTGVIFEAVFKGTTQVGSIAAGGRYDNLIGMFGTKQVPAVGVSIGIERVFSIMEQVHKDRNQGVRASETQVLVSVLGEDLSVGAEVAAEVWKGKLKAELMVNKRVMKHIQRAKESKIPWMVIVGEREMNEGVVKLKDIEANKEHTIPRTQLVQQLRTCLAHQNPLL